MPEFTAMHIGFLALTLVIGVVLGWIFRGDRCAKEKIAVNASWQEQIDAQQSEHDRLSEQNISLMEQVGQYQASNKDAKMRARELSEALKEAFERRDELQRNLKEIRGHHEIVTAQRDRLLSDIEHSNVRGVATAGALKEKDDKIFRLSRELTSWQNRVPPLVEKFKERDQEVQKLREELEQADQHIVELKASQQMDQTRIEPMDADTLPNGLDASNDPDEAGMSDSLSIPEDQIDASPDIHDSLDDDSAGEHYSEATAVAAEDVADIGEIGEIGDVAQAEAANGNDTNEQEAITDSAGDTSDAADRTEPMSAEGNVDGRDRLQLIKGVGPAIEKTLNKLGIFRFSQIAEMSEYDIDRVAQQLRGFRSRIYREDWIGQARTLQYQKNNDLY